MSYLFINILFKLGITAVMYASERGHFEIVRTLLQRGADVNAKSNVRNQMMMMIILY